MALTDTQIALLRHAVADPDGILAVELPQGDKAREAVAPLEDLLAQGYLEAADGQAAGGGPRRSFRITPGGREALGPGPADG